MLSFSTWSSTDQGACLGVGGASLCSLIPSLRGRGVTTLTLQTRNMGVQEGTRHITPSPALAAPRVQFASFLIGVETWKRALILFCGSILPPTVPGAQCPLGALGAGSVPGAYGVPWVLAQCLVLTTYNWPLVSLGARVWFQSGSVLPQLMPLGRDAGGSRSSGGGRPHVSTRDPRRQVTEGSVLRPRQGRLFVG